MLMTRAALHDPSERENQAVSSTRWILAHSSKRCKSQGSERDSTGDCFERYLKMKKAVGRAVPLTFSKTNVIETPHHVPLGSFKEMALSIEIIRTSLEVELALTLYIFDFLTYQTYSLFIEHLY
jgi:hypothetical protein